MFNKTIPAWVQEFVATVQARIVVQHRRSGRLWAGGDTWTRERDAARSFTSAHEAYRAASAECGLAPEAYEALPLALIEDDE